MKDDNSVSGNTPGPDLLFPEAVQKILREYSAFLENCAPQPGRIVDIVELPYSKREIKDAIIACLASDIDRETRLRLHSAYLALADWQAGVGSEPLALTLLNMSAANDPDGGDQVLHTFAARDMDQWNIRVVDERRQLALELKALDPDTP
jgi:hypothetical protein